jgi:hypothetical protein
VEANAPKDGDGKERHITLKDTRDPNPQGGHQEPDGGHPRFGEGVNKARQQGRQKAGNLACRFQHAKVEGRRAQPVAQEILEDAAVNRKAKGEEKDQRRKRAPVLSESGFLLRRKRRLQ